MFIKLGISPFHTWFISILKTCSLFILIILSSIQKIIPLIILNNIYINYLLFYLSIIITIIFIIFILSSVINLNKLLAISSLGNILWLISRNILSLKLIFLFILIIFSALILLYHYISRIYFFLTYVPSIKFGLNYTNNSWIKYLYLISLVIFILNLLF